MSKKKYQKNQKDLNDYVISTENMDKVSPDYVPKRDSSNTKKKRFDSSILFQPVFDKEFDPNSKYQVTSEDGAIKNWQDLVVVLLVVALSVMAFTAILIRYEILENPFAEKKRYDLSNVYVSGWNQILDQLTIDYPSSGSTVNGVIKLNGRITGDYVGLSINVYDGSNNKLGSEEIREFSEIDGIKYYDTSLFIEESPQSTEGNIIITTISSTQDQEKREISSNIKVTFTSEVEELDTYLISPIPFQLSTQNTQVRFWGHSENYRELQLGLELKEDSNGTSLAKFTIEPNIDGDIIKEISLVGISGIGGTYKSGRWVLISPSGDVITEIPVLFEKTY